MNKIKKKFLKNRKKLMKMNGSECIKYLQGEIESYEESMLREKEKGNLSGFFFMNNNLELYKNLYDNLKLDPQSIREFKNIITHEDILRRKFEEIRLNNLLRMNGEFFVEYLQQNIKEFQELLEGPLLNMIPIKREDIEKSLLKDKNDLSKLEKEPDYIYKMKENFRNTLNSLKKTQI